jgi:cyclase
MLVITRCLAALYVLGALAQPQAAEVVPINTIAVADGISMLVGRGGNVAVAHGADGVFVIDDQYAEQYDVIQQAIAKLAGAPVKFLINTHWHSDHSGSNEQMAKSGALIVAHDNVRQRLSTDQVIEFFKAQRPASPPAAFPVVTFSKDISFHLNGDEVNVFHVLNAHTDGDAVVHFKRANVIHTGDVYFNGRYPFIDSGSGGSIGGMITAVEQILALTDANTLIIPGHGDLSDSKGLEAYRDMLRGTQHAIANLMVSGATVEQALLAKPTAAFDAQWGGGFLKPDVYVRMVWDSITRETLD